MVVISARSFVIFPLSIVAIVAFPDGLQMRKVLRFHPFPAFSECAGPCKMVATELVDVSSPFK